MPTGRCCAGEFVLDILAKLMPSAVSSIWLTNPSNAKAVCHCRDCKKTSGSTYGTSIIVPGQGFSVTSGTPKTFSKTADSGATVTSHFCGDCGSTLFRESKTHGTSKVVKVGMLDDPFAFEAAKPMMEIFVHERPSWVSKVEGAVQLRGMPRSEVAA